MRTPTSDKSGKTRVDTMAELADAIKVSRPTLSRYFQDPEKVSRSSRVRIEAGLEGVEYVPNFFASRMNRKSTGVIGVIIPYLNDLFFTKLLEAIERSAMDAGYTVITQCSHSDPLIEARAAETLMSMNVDGALVAPLGNESDERVHERLEARLPFVLVDSRPQSLPDVDFVGTDHQQSTALATQYLCRVGSPPIFLAMPRVNFNAIERERAYVSAMEELGHEPRVIGADIVNESWFFESHGQAVLAREFAAGRLIESSLLCANDRVAIGALSAAAAHGLEPGANRRGGLRIMGHDDYPLCPFTVPSLTTVAQNVEGIGREAVRQLIQSIRKKKPSDEQVVKLFDGELKLRQSA